MKNKAKQAAIDWLLSIGVFITLISLIGIGYVLSDDQATVRTRVNITAGLPIINSIQVNYGNAINLTPGTVYEVLCNVTIVNYNELGDFTQVNATFYRTNGTGIQFGLFDTHNNNSWYHHTNCTYARTAGAFTYDWNCTFNVTYHAYNGSWNCTVFVNNSLNTPVNRSNSSWILPLIAINVTDTLNFGDLAVYDQSDILTINVTNFGNMPINYTLWGHGAESNETGYNLSFRCPDGYGTNISIGYLRWGLRDSMNYENKVNLSIGPLLVDNTTVHKQTTDANIWNTTYWQLYVPPNPFGACNGTIVIEALLGQ